MVLPAKLSITNSNYTSFTKNTNGETKLKEVESWVTLRSSKNISVWKGGTFSRDAGVKLVTNFEGERPTLTATPAFEAKYKQNIINNEDLNLSLGIRGRLSNEINGRFYAEETYKANDKLSFSGALHYTVSTNGVFNPEQRTTIGQKAGGYLTVSYQVTPRLNIWCDPVQVNYNISKGGWEVFPNAGFSYKLN